MEADIYLLREQDYLDMQMMQHSLAMEMKTLWESGLLLLQSDHNPSLYKLNFPSKDGKREAIDVLVGTRGIAHYLRMEIGAVENIIAFAAIKPIDCLNRLEGTGKIYRQDDLHEAVCVWTEKFGVSAPEASRHLGLTQDSFSKIAIKIPFQRNGRFARECLDGFIKFVLKNRRNSFSNSTDKTTEFIAGLTEIYLDTFEMDTCHFCKVEGLPPGVAREICASCSQKGCTKHIPASTGKRCPDCRSEFGP